MYKRQDIDTALCAWNGNIESKHAVVRYMKEHAREKDTAAWLAQEYGGSNSLFVVRAGSPEETQDVYKRQHHCFPTLQVPVP